MKNTINDAITIVLKNEHLGLSSKDIYNKILEQNLYTFKSKTPYHVMLTQLRRHCGSFDFKSANKQKLYELNDGKFRLKKSNSIQ